VVAPAYVDYGLRRLGLNEQTLNCVLVHTGFFWSLANLLASSVTELNDTLPYLMGDTMDSAWAPTVCPPRHTC
jgi:hypothetical protein